jgi:cellulose synthase/poly-beta-1,6-N-acetylglucosamine synthase-like glycosyltransferase
VFAHFNLGIYVLATIAFFVDLFDVLLRLYLRREHTLPGDPRGIAPTSVPLDIGSFTPYESRLHLRPYAIVASIHNLDRASLDRFLDNMAPYRAHLWIIDDMSTDDTWERLQASGVHCMRGASNQKKPGAIKTLLATLPESIDSIVVVDPDVRIVNSAAEFETVVFQFQRTGMGALCPRIAVRADGALSRFQQLEYCFSFALGRKSLGDMTITSGIAIYRRDALERLLTRHSLSVYAEDLENTFLLMLDGDRVYYDGRIVAETEGMTDCRTLFSQRVGWNFGLIKVYADYCRPLLGQCRRGFIFTYQYIVYTGVLTLLLHPLKLLGLVLLALSAINGIDNLAGLHAIADTPLTNPAYFVMMYLKYTALVLAAFPLIAPKSERRFILPVLPVYVFYGLAQVLPASVGYLNWIALRTYGQRVYHDHYQEAAP